MFEKKLVILNLGIPLLAEIGPLIQAVLRWMTIINTSAIAGNKNVEQSILQCSVREVSNKVKRFNGEEMISFCLGGNTFFADVSGFRFSSPCHSLDSKFPGDKLSARCGWRIFLQLIFDCIHRARLDPQPLLMVL